MIAPLLAIASKRFPSLEKAIADGGYQGKPTADDVKEQAGIPLEIVKRSDAAKGFYVLPKRWIVERTYGWLNRCRRLVKDYENLTRNHAAFIISRDDPADATSNCKARGRNIKCPDGLLGPLCAHNFLKPCAWSIATSPVTLACTTKECPRATSEQGK